MGPSGKTFAGPTIQELAHCASAAEEIEEEHDDRDDQEGVNQAAAHMHRKTRQLASASGFVPSTRSKRDVKFTVCCEP